MNHSLVVLVIGRLCALMGAVLLVPAAVSYFSDDHSRVVYSFLITSAVAWGFSAVSTLSTFKKTRRLGVADGFACVSLSWVVVAILGALPYLISEAIPHISDAFFESMSGITTTGASILSDIESLPTGIKFWRCLTQWLGGMGIVVLFVALLPALGAGGNSLFQVEAPGPSSGRMTPRISETAKVLWTIYVVLTGTLVLILWICGMNLFDSVCHGFATLGTGGFSTKNQSIEAYSNTIQWVITMFMFLGGVNFAMYYFALHREVKRVYANTEVRLFFGLVLVSTLSIAFLLMVQESPGISPSEWSLDAFLDSLRLAAFQVVSLTTSTGYGTADYALWPATIQIILVLLMLFGACAGSTSGGIKLVRFLILWGFWKREIRRRLHPNAVVTLKIHEKVVTRDVVDATTGFFILYVGLYVVAVLVLSALGQSNTVAISAPVACLSNVGPGLGEIGPKGNYGDLPAFAKWFLAILMLLGRLEIYAVLVLFVPSFWKRRATLGTGGE